MWICSKNRQKKRRGCGRCTTGASAGSVSTYLASRSSHLKNASFYFPPSLFFHQFLEEPYICNILLWWAFFLYNVRACCRRASTLYCSTVITDSTAQRNQPGTKPQSKNVRADQSATTQACRQSLREPAHVVERLFIQHAEFSKRTKKSKISPAYKNYNYCTYTALVWCAKDLPLVSILMYKVQPCALSPPLFVCISYMHAASGLLSWSMELLPFFASRQFVPIIVELLCPLHSLFVLFFLVSERTGWFKCKRRKLSPPRMPHAIILECHIFGIILTAMNSGRG